MNTTQHETATNTHETFEGFAEIKTEPDASPEETHTLNIDSFEKNALINNQNETVQFVNVNVDFGNPLPNPKTRNNINKSDTPKAFSCSLCTKTFAYKRSLNRHMIYHESEKKFKCDICPERFVYKKFLQSHRKTHNAKEIYTCEACNSVFSSRDEYCKHQAKHEGDGRFLFVNEGKSDVVDGVKEESMEECVAEIVMHEIKLESVALKERKEETFGDERELGKISTGGLKEESIELIKKEIVVKEEEHVEESQNEQFQFTNEEITDSRSQSIRENSLKNSENGSNKNDQFEFANELDSSFSHQISYDIKIVSDFSNLPNPSQKTDAYEPKKRFACAICPKTFAHRQGLAKHVKSHEDKKKIKCDKCSMCFSHVKFFNAHARVHNVGGKYVCEFCGRGFESRGSYYWHRSRYHKGEGSGQEGGGERGVGVENAENDGQERGMCV